MKQEMTGWQWHQLDHMQIICTSLQTDNHARHNRHSIFHRPDALPDAHQQCESTEANKIYTLTEKNLPCKAASKNGSLVT